MMRVWEYEVPEANREEFERNYAADGDWARLFALSDDFLGTELFTSPSEPGHYLTIDRFTSVASWGRFSSEHREAYGLVDEATAGLTSQERELVQLDDLDGRDRRRAAQ